MIFEQTPDLAPCICDFLDRNKARNSEKEEA